ncbi:MAG: hypothetical protein AB7O21_17690 [Gammaproteobacteria bacterium]
MTGTSPTFAPHPGLRVACMLAGLVLLVGCATTSHVPALPPQPGLADVHRLIRAHAAQDARFQVVTDHPWLQLDLAHRYRLADYPRTADLTARRVFVAQFLRETGEVADRSVALALAKIPREALAAFAAAQQVPLRNEDALTAVRDAVLADQRMRREIELADLARFMTPAEIDRYWQDVTGHVEASIMSRGRLARRLLTAPAVPFISAWITYHNRTDFRGPTVPAFAHATEFTLAEGTPPPEIPPADWALLARHAPVIVQERAEHPAYPATLDRFGTVALREHADDVEPTVDADAPALYAFVDRKRVQGREVRQLVYTLWYPAHPHLSRFDPEAGPLDGWTVRLTLDARDQPALVESVSNCGCYYKIFPSAALEAAAAAAFPRRLDGKGFHLEQDVPDRVDAVVPETVATAGGAAHQIVLYFSAGHHQLVSVRTPHTRAGTADAAASYALHPYEILERLPARGHDMGLFGDDGLVRAAHRPECDLLTPSGLYHAGHPRQRETQMIYFDEADFDEPTLLERYLRLPPDAFGASS